LGGSTCEATVLRTGTDGLTVLGNAGVADLGGRNFDEAVLALMMDQVAAGPGQAGVPSAAALGTLRRAAEGLKLRLSAPATPAVRVAVVSNRVFEVVLTPGQFQRATASLVDRALGLCAAAMQTAGIGWKDVAQLLLVGGSTLLPIVETRLRRASGLPADRVRRHQPQLAVAFGAALAASGTSGLAGTRKMVERTAGAALGFRVLDPATRKPTVDVIIPSGTPIPARKAVTYYSNRPDQARTVFEVVQVVGSETEPSSLGNFAFLLERPRKNHPLEVALGYDHLGLVTVEARDPETGRAVRREYGDDTLTSQGELVATVQLLE
jgi:molecular chaperone DnaK